MAPALPTCSQGWGRDCPCLFLYFSSQREWKQKTHLVSEVAYSLAHAWCQCAPSTPEVFAKTAKLSVVCMFWGGRKGILSSAPARSDPQGNFMHLVCPLVCGLLASCSVLFVSRALFSTVTPCERNLYNLLGGGAVMCVYTGPEWDLGSPSKTLEAWGCSSDLSNAFTVHFFLSLS